MQIPSLLPLAAALLAGLVIGGVIVGLFVQRRYAVRLASAETERLLLREQLSDIAGAAAVERAGERESTAAALAPLAQALSRVERQVALLERDRVEQFGQIGERLDQVAGSTHDLRRHTAGLVGALNASSVRGAWGEAQLRRILELSGMLPHCDFDEQVSALSSHGARLRPDLVVHLPGERIVVIDAKSPLTAFLTAQREELTAAQRTEALRSHATDLRRHVDALAAKEYWAAFRSSPEFVVCFVPSDAILAAALTSDPALYDHAQERRVVLTSPATLLALLRTVSLAWQRDSVATNAVELLAVGRELYARLGTLGGHLDKMGSSLKRSVEHYNALVGTLESRVFVTARQLRGLDIVTANPPAVSPLDIAPRPMTLPELIDAVGPDSDDFAVERSLAERHRAATPRDVSG